jgi:hypothetical protein
MFRWIYEEEHIIRNFLQIKALVLPDLIMDLFCEMVSVFQWIGASLLST